MRFDLLTLFPEIFDSYLSQSLLKQAIDGDLISVHRWNIRDYGIGRHHVVDDRPYGGGPGMLLKCEPVFAAVEAVQQESEDPGVLVMMTPQGERLTQRVVEKLAKFPRLILLCGRYEGFDERIRIGLKPWEISAGDFICNGGEVPAMLVMDSVMRLVPGVLGDETSSKYESFAENNLIEHPQYTRPRLFRGMEVPEVLLGGNHGEIAEWREELSRKRTAERRDADSED